MFHQRLKIELISSKPCVNISYMCLNVMNYSFNCITIYTIKLPYINKVNGDST